MNVREVLDRVNSLGVTITLDGDHLLLEPGSRVPSDLVEVLRQHKPEVIALLSAKQGNTKTKPLSGRYRPKYPEGQARDKELAEIVHRVHREGFVLLWSKVLEDFVAFYRDEQDKAKIPPGFVPYSEVELWELFGEGKPPVSQHELRLIHEAKKLGGHTISNDR